MSVGKPSSLARHAASGNLLRMQLLLDVLRQAKLPDRSMSPGRGPNAIRFSTCTMPASSACRRRAPVTREAASSAATAAVKTRAALGAFHKSP